MTKILSANSSTTLRAQQMEVFFLRVKKNVDPTNGSLQAQQMEGFSDPGTFLRFSALFRRDLPAAFRFAAHSLSLQRREVSTLIFPLGCGNDENLLKLEAKLDFLVNPLVLRHPKIP